VRYILLVGAASACTLLAGKPDVFLGIAAKASKLVRWLGRAILEAGAGAGRGYDLFMDKS
jgi:hypothetical protein